MTINMQKTLKQTKTKGKVVIDNISISYFNRNKNVYALRDISTIINPGEFVCLLGPSGCGKSSLLNGIAGFVDPSKGQFYLDNKKIMGPSPEMGMVFQQYSLYPWKTVKENIAFGPSINNRGDESPEKIAMNFLEMIGLSKYANHYPNELSGGMQQRVGIARALANYPDVLLMDEPFGALDSQTRIIMQENLLKLWREFKITVVFVTHDIDEAVFLADRILLMSTLPGKIKKDLKIDLPRPRDKETTDSSRFIELRQICHSLIREESLKAFEKQNQL
ncbi:MAG: ABC transporter ATP-binding protein [Prochlorococcus marinus subsp. pastoris]